MKKWWYVLPIVALSLGGCDSEAALTAILSAVDVAGLVAALLALLGV